MKKSGLILLIILLAYSAFAEVETLGTFKQNECIELKQSCANCTYTNLTSIQLPNSTVIKISVLMTKIGIEYNYTFCDTDLLGGYIVNGFSDVDGTNTVWAYDFEVTTTGEQVSLSNVILVIAFLLISGLLFIIGSSFEKEKYIIKSSFYLFSLLMGLLSINSARIIASESLNLSSMANMGLIVLITIISFMFLLVLVYYTIQTVKSFKRKEGIRWEY